MEKNPIRSKNLFICPKYKTFQIHQWQMFSVKANYSGWFFFFLRSFMKGGANLMGWFVGHDLAFPGPPGALPGPVILWPPLQGPAPNNITPSRSRKKKARATKWTFLFFNTFMWWIRMCIQHQLRWQISKGNFKLELQVSFELFVFHKAKN